jgi:hypothetical protein
LAGMQAPATAAAMPSRLERSLALFGGDEHEI